MLHDFKVVLNDWKSFRCFAWRHAARFVSSKKRNVDNTRRQPLQSHPFLSLISTRKIIQHRICDELQALVSRIQRIGSLITCWHIKYMRLEGRFSGIGNTSWVVKNTEKKPAAQGPNLCCSDLTLWCFCSSFSYGTAASFNYFLVQASC